MLDRPEPARRPVRVAVQRSGGRVRHLRAADPRAVPVHHHVPDHVDHHPARAPLGHARAAHDDPARQGRLHRRLCARVRAHGDAAGRRDRVVRGVGVRTRDRRPGLAARSRRRHRRRARHGAGTAGERVRAHGVPGGAVHAADRVPADPAGRTVHAARGHARGALCDHRTSCRSATRSTRSTR